MHPGELICQLVLSLKIHIPKVTGVSFGTPKDYATKPQNDHTNNPILEIPTQPQMTGFLSIFVLIQSLRLRLFLHLTKIEPLKSYEKCFLFHLNCSFGSCNIQILRGK